MDFLGVSFVAAKGVQEYLYLRCRMGGLYSYVVAKRLVIKEGNSATIKVPIEVSHTVIGERGHAYFLEGSFRIDGEIFDAVKVYNEYGDFSSADHYLSSELVGQFWEKESEIITRFYKDAQWCIEENDYDIVSRHLKKYSVFGEENVGDHYYGEANYWKRIRHLKFVESKEKQFDAYSVRNHMTFSYFNKYVRCVNVYLYNTEFKGCLNVDVEFIYRVAESMFARSFEGAGELIEKLRNRNLYPIFIGELPKPNEFPFVPSDIWLLAWNPGSEVVDDMFSVELLELENWLSTYSAPTSLNSLWISIQKFLEKNSDEKEFYTVDPSDYSENSTLFRQYWEEIEQIVSESFAAFSALTITRKKKLFAITIEQLDLSVRAYNCLRRAGINTIADIVSKTEAELQKVRNLGKKATDEIIAKVNSLALDIAPLSRAEIKKTFKLIKSDTQKER